MPPASNTISSLYSDEALRRLTEQVYSNALLIYRDLAVTWFPTLKSTLGLACAMPVLFTGRVMPMADDWNGPGFAYDMDRCHPLSHLARRSALQRRRKSSLALIPPTCRR